MKNSIKWFVVPILLISLFCCASTLAEIVDSGTCGTGVSWELDSDGLLTISGNGRMNNYYNYGGHTPRGAQTQAP